MSFSLSNLNAANERIPERHWAWSYNPSGSWTATRPMTSNGKRDGFSAEDFEACAPLGSGVSLRSDDSVSYRKRQPVILWGVFLFAPRNIGLTGLSRFAGSAVWLRLFDLRFRAWQSNCVHHPVGSFLFRSAKYRADRIIPLRGLCGLASLIRFALPRMAVELRSSSCGEFFCSLREISG